MKHLKFGLLFAMLFLLGTSTLQAQTTRYFHTDTLNISTTSRDSTYTTVWESATLFCNDDIYIRVGAPDIGSWTSRNWLLVPAGYPLTIGPRPNLKKLSVKTTSVSTSILYLFGYKKTAQF